MVTVTSVAPHKFTISLTDAELNELILALDRPVVHSSITQQILYSGRLQLTYCNVEIG